MVGGAGGGGVPHTVTWTSQVHIFSPQAMRQTGEASNVHQWQSPAPNQQIVNDWNQVWTDKGPNVQKAGGFSPR